MSPITDNGLLIPSIEPCLGSLGEAGLSSS